MRHFFCFFVCLAVVGSALSFQQPRTGRVHGVRALHALSDVARPRALSTMKKQDLIDELKRLGLEYDGTVPELKARIKKARVTRPVRKTGASLIDKVENPDTLPESMARVIAPSEALTDSATTVVAGVEAPEGSLKKNKIPKVELIKIRSNYLFDPLQEEMTDDRYVPLLPISPQD